MWIDAALHCWSADYLNGVLRQGEPVIDNGERMPGHTREGGIHITVYRASGMCTGSSIHPTLQTKDHHLVPNSSLINRRWNSTRVPQKLFRFIRNPLARSHEKYSNCRTKSNEKAGYGHNQENLAVRRHSIESICADNADHACRYQNMCMK